jgi:hypothetical protein
MRWSLLELIAIGFLVTGSALASPMEIADNSPGMKTGSGITGLHPSLIRHLSEFMSSSDFANLAHTSHENHNTWIATPSASLEEDCKIAVGIMKGLGLRVSVAKQRSSCCGIQGVRCIDSSRVNYLRLSSEIISREVKAFPISITRLKTLETMYMLLIKIYEQVSLYWQFRAEFPTFRQPIEIVCATHVGACVFRHLTTFNDLKPSRK